MKTQNLNNFSNEKEYKIESHLSNSMTFTTTASEEIVKGETTIKVVFQNKSNEEKALLDKESVADFNIEFNEKGQLATSNEDIIKQNKEFFEKVSNIVNKTTNDILNTIRQEAEEEYVLIINNGLQNDLDEDYEPEREDGLKVSCENHGETYLEEVDVISIHFAVTIENDNNKVEFQYNVGDNEESFDEEFFLKQHGDDLRSQFNEEQVDYIAKTVGSVINQHLSRNHLQPTPQEEYELATEFDATDVEVKKVKIAKEDDRYNCITTIDYQDEEYKLSLKAEKKSDSYDIDMKSLDFDIKDNKIFKEKVEQGFSNSVISSYFDLENIEKVIKEKIEKGLMEKQKERKEIKRGINLST